MLLITSYLVVGFVLWAFLAVQFEKNIESLSKGKMIAVPWVRHARLAFLCLAWPATVLLFVLCKAFPKLEGYIVTGKWEKPDAG